jgi:hypothetical protein
MVILELVYNWVCHCWSSCSLLYPPLSLVDFTSTFFVGDKSMFNPNFCHDMWPMKLTITGGRSTRSTHGDMLRCWGPGLVSEDCSRCHFLCLSQGCLGRPEGMISRYPWLNPLTSSADCKWLRGLVNSHITMEHHHVSWVTISTGPFSIAILT